MSRTSNSGHCTAVNISSPLSRQEALPLRPQTRQNKLLTDPEDEALGTANYVKAAGISVAGRFCTACLPPMAARSRHSVRMHESTPRHWNLASANWRIRSTSFGSRERGG